ncbi:type II toxin-antitoxin system CcdA family antitoxin [Citrobacter freundii]|uniref:type II toxin-antitoxin system CcdA family antitoxin n=1 Tax=Citrobacter sp. wls711 TaxID=2576425 RepID=UPI000BBD2BCE|nr:MULTISPECIES: type II toxin-antitoxin system CcdA family antitoxin [Citrobacter]HEE0107025.1 type II toxin-antitoxin system CcdA family antitoxin [Citrobacter gillenii]ATF51339.1 post-segregation antitoxin CcdA [Citrobacter werkmanii]EJB8473468.1 type II toxin-antitoxin system CcdA family antitoxin [Citrobacter freundii]EJB8559397.1 type II toxin-antitoxin system CcdA family antitoxin [Citrobacter freundii]MBA8031256.1 type II toxin-antitoxin system CcdA family antitoxin [Citrobacter freund
MLSYYANLRYVMRITMGVIMRTVSKVKKSVNVSLAPEILEEARKLKINLSAVLTEALIEKFRENKREEWLRDNKKSIEVLNQWVEENGSFSDFQRTF